MASLTEMASKVMGKPVASDPDAQPTKKVSPPIKPPKDVQKRIDRGRERLKQVAPRRKLAVDFVNGNHYGWIGEDQVSYNQSSTVTFSNGGGMPDHRIRRSHDLLGPIVKRKISTSVQRVPGYEVIPSNESEQAYLAAKISEKVAYAGYDKWEIKRATKKLIWNALVTEEGFIGARWDSSVGPYVDVSQDPENPAMPHPVMPEYVGMGEIKIVVYGGLEVLSEPGIEFEDSRWFAIENAVPAASLEDDPDFIDNGIKLKPDAETSSIPKPQRLRTGTELVMRTEYLERPCLKWPEGRQLVMANGRVIFPEARYPKEDGKGKVLDEPPLHRLSYQVDAASDKNRGLVQSLIEPMRSYDQAMNKAEEGVELGMNPQLMVPIGALSEETPVTDEPGIVIEYDPMISPNAEPKWKQNYQNPDDVYRQSEIAKGELSQISFDTEIPQSAESGKQVQAIYELNEVGWQDFILELADVHAALMRDCLTLVQHRYSEERLTNFKGAAGWEDLAEFRGADIQGQTEVRVEPGSLEPRTRAGIEARITMMNRELPGYFPPPVFLSALNKADPDKLTESFENDEARAYRIITLIKNGGFWNMPPRPLIKGEEAPLLDPVTEEPVMNFKTGQPFQMESVPGWMPRSFDNADIHKNIFETWMKTADYDELDPEQKQAAMLYYQALLDIESKMAQRRNELQTQMAEQAGAQNAATAGQPKVMPSMPQPSSPGNQPEPIGAS